MPVVPLMVDLSSNNALPDLRAHYAVGYRILCLKVTEGTSYAWAASHALAAQWHTLGADAIVWHYHFLHPGTVASGAAQADWFWAHVKADLRPGDRVVCDVETKGETGSEVSGFWTRYLSHDPHTPRVDYGGPYFFRDNHIRPQHGEDLWLADYDTHPAFIPPGWSSWLAWQYTDRATGVPGIHGAVDQSHVTKAALPTPPPPPKPPELDVQSFLVIIEDTRPLFITDAITKRWVQSEAERQEWLGRGVKEEVWPKVKAPILAAIALVGPPPK